jgi:release factor glutamine methyltransferase
MAEAWTVRRVIAWTQADFERRGIESARLDADLIVAHALGLKRIALYLDLDRPLIDGELSQIRQLVERRRVREPMAYILGEREFYGRAFEVNRDVLIPRPDTETLVEHVLAFLGGAAPEGPVLDLCVGSGAIAVTLAAEHPARSFVATDISAAALSVAGRNAARHGVNERLSLRQGDLFGALKADEQFACMTVNPPYIGTEEFESLLSDVREFEPRLALDAGTDALLFYRRLAQAASRHLLPGGAIFAEVGYTQAQAVAALWAEAGLIQVRTYRDLAGVERVVAGTHASAV